MKHRLLFLSLSIIFNLSSFAASITGKVCESPSVGVGYATVVCYRVPDSLITSSCVSDSTGSFTLTNVGEGKYCVKCSMIGYVSALKDSVIIKDQTGNIHLGNIKMKADAKEMKELLVVAEGNTEGGVDKSTFKISDKLSAVAPTGVDVLKYIPAVQVNLMQEVSVDGSSNIQYLIDGRKVTVEDVKQLDARKISKVEVVHNPSSKYDADITAVINVILKTGINFGLSGKVSTESHFTDKTLSNSDISLEYGYKNLRFFCDGHLNLLSLDFDDKVENTEAGSSYTTNGSGRVNNIYSSVSTGVDWKINKKNSLLYQIQYKPNFGDNSNADATTNYLDNGVSKAYSMSAVYQNTSSHSLKNYLYYRHSFEKEGHELTMSAEYTKRDQDEHNQYEETIYQADRQTVTTPLQKRDYKTENNKYNSDLCVDYSLPIGKSTTFKTGYDLNMQWFRNKFNVSDASFDYDEYRNSAYINLNHSIRNLSLQAGLRYEQADVTLSDTTSIQYNSFLPQFSMQYKIGKMHKFKFSYRRSITRPMVQNMNPFVEIQDSLHISHGNPDLDPSYEDKFELSYTWMFRTSIYYRNFSKVNQSVTDLRTDGIYETTTANVGNGCEYGATLGSMLPVRKWWSINLYGSLYKQEVFAEDKYSIEGRNSWCYRTYISNMLMLPKDITLSTMFYYNTPSISGQMTTRPQMFYGFGIDKKFKSSLTLGLSVFNPFNDKYYFRDETTYGNGFIQQHKTAAHVPYLINFKMSYLFNKGKKLDKQERPKNEDAEDNLNKMF